MKYYKVLDMDMKSIYDSNLKYRMNELYSITDRIAGTARIA